jgi:hypothetical protein
LSHCAADFQSFPRRSLTQRKKTNLPTLDDRSPPRTATARSAVSQQSPLQALPYPRSGQPIHSSYRLPSEIFVGPGLKSGQLSWLAEGGEPRSTLGRYVAFLLPSMNRRICQ